MAKPGGTPMISSIVTSHSRPERGGRCRGGSLLAGVVPVRVLYLALVLAGHAVYDAAAVKPASRSPALDPDVGLVDIRAWSGSEAPEGEASEVREAAGRRGTAPARDAPQRSEHGMPKFWPTQECSLSIHKFSTVAVDNRRSPRSVAARTPPAISRARKSPVLRARWSAGGGPGVCRPRIKGAGGHPRRATRCAGTATALVSLAAVPDPHLHAVFSCESARLAGRRSGER
jgi:hypothetical protein